MQKSKQKSCNFRLINYIVPYVIDLQEEVPGNKMYWKFFELPRFGRCVGNLSPEELNSPKIQWLKFFTSCSTIEEIPPGIEDESIKKAYEFMNLENWDRDKRLKYWELKSLADAEAEDRRNQDEERKRQADRADHYEREAKRLKEENKDAELKGKAQMLLDLVKGGMDLETLQKYLSSKFNTGQISTI